ncbi:MAG TPA: CPBP family intramembrane glutamic endopeptidase [Solirubrobacteraceae bacterium]|nr:CPBP family intramembrane glutamic endopeptidase [Solirubrobacteraceae bacterium]
MIVSARQRVLPWPAPVACIGAIVACQIVTLAAGPTAGAVGDAVVVFAALNVYARRSELRPAAALAVLALVPLMMLIGAAIPGKHLAPALRDGLVAALLLQALWVTAGIVSLDWAPLELPGRDVRRQLRIAACGIPLGIVAELLLRPHPLVRAGNPAGIVVAVVVLGCLAAPSLELLFRWAVQDQLAALYGDAGLVVTNVLFAGLYLVTGSAGYVALMGITGLGLSLAVRRTGSVWGAVGAHALLTVGALVIWPLVL